MKKKLIFFTLFLAVTMLIVPVSSEAAKRVKLNKKSVSLYEGKSIKLKVSGTKAKVKWSSNKKSVATVTSKGKVTARKKGIAKITAKVSGKKYTCKVTVKKKRASNNESADSTNHASQSNNKNNTPSVIRVTGISLNYKSANLRIGDTCLLSAVITPSNAANTSVAWSSSNPAVASVSSTGIVTALSTGTATITATTADGSHTASCIVNVQSEFNILKEYILTYGAVNTDGNKFIKYDQDGLTYAIVYDSTAQTFKFINSGTMTTSEGVSAANALTLIVKESDTKKGDITFIILIESTLGGKTIATTELSKITSNDDIAWTIESTIGLSASSVTGLANSYLRLSYSGWNLLLLSTNTGITMGGLGFGA